MWCRGSAVTGDRLKKVLALFVICSAPHLQSAQPGTDVQQLPPLSNGHWELSRAQSAAVLRGPPTSVFPAVAETFSPRLDPIGPMYKMGCIPSAKPRTWLKAGGSNEQRKKQMNGTFVAKSSDLIHRGKKRRVVGSWPSRVRKFPGILCHALSHHWTSTLQHSGMIQRFCASVAPPIKWGQ